MNKQIILLSILLFLFAGCGKTVQPPTEVDIVVPSPCILNPGTTVPLSFNGFIPGDSTIKWSANSGSFDKDDAKIVNFTAPTDLNSVTISLTIKTLNPSGENIFTKTCSIISVPEGNPSVTIGIPSPTTISPTDDIVTILTPTETKATVSDHFTIVISEVMANPCGDEDSNKSNEYVELYNYGDIEIDVKGWYLTTTGQGGDSDALVSWNSRYSNTSVNEAITDSTIIPPKSFAVVISPVYTIQNSSNIMPYTFPKQTVILTIEEGKRIGNKALGILSSPSAQRIDGVFLYIGTKTQVKRLVSTYGVKNVGSYTNIFSPQPGLPKAVEMCFSIQRKMLPGEDIPENWEAVHYGNPGEGP